MGCNLSFIRINFLKHDHALFIQCGGIECKFHVHTAVCFFRDKCRLCCHFFSIDPEQFPSFFEHQFSFYRVLLTNDQVLVGNRINNSHVFLRDSLMGSAFLIFCRRSDAAVRKFYRLPLVFQIFMCQDFFLLKKDFFKDHDLFSF